MARLRLRELAAPLDYAEIRRSYQVVRAMAALVVGSLGVLGLAWGFDGWALFVAPAAISLAHAAFRLIRPGKRATVPLLVDTTMLGCALLALGDLPQAEFAVVAYLLTASLLLTSLTEAALLLAYAALWGALVANFAPVTEVGRFGRDAGLTWVRVAGVAFLVLVAVLLLAASKVVHAFRERQEEALESERRAGALKSEFVSMVSHEFRTPLTSIAGFVETLLESRHSLSDEEIDEFLHIVQSEAHHLATLVEDVLVIPRLEAGRLPLEFEDFELRATAQQVIDRVFPPGDGSEATVVVPNGVTVRGDPRRVVQILRNLLENARKYGGDQILVEGIPDGEMLKVIVSDNGTGIPPEHVERVFDHFEQVSRGDARTTSGIGLGLPIAQKLIRVMGGDLWYEPRFPTGSRFCFTLRLVRAASPTPAGDPVPVAPD